MATDYFFDDKSADHACKFFETYLFHSKAQFANNPFILQPWQKKIIREVFGWKRADGTRKYRTVYIEIPRKNGKSSMASGIALYLLLCDKEPGAEIYSAAADREQASIIFDMAKNYITNNPELEEKVEIFKRSIVCEKTLSSYKVLSADAKTKHGFNPHGIIFDELHAQPNADLYDTLITGTGVRRQPLTFITTTAGYDTDSICYKIHEYASNILAGKVDDPTFYPVIFAASENDDWQDPEVWAKANPNLGVTFQKDFLETEIAKAKQMPDYENTFKRLYLNIWTEQDQRWISEIAWKDCAEKFDVSALLGFDCYAALDLSTTTDFTALNIVFPLPGDNYKTLSWFWLPEARITGKFQDGVNYQAWVTAGFIEKTEGNVVDYSFVKSRLINLKNLYNIKEVIIDRWNASQLAQELEAEGFQVALMGQGFASMSPASKEFENKMLSKKLRHNDNPVLNWQIGNVSLERDAAGNIKPSKKKSKKRIDGVVAMIMALYRAVLNRQTTGEEPGIVVL